jgi:hypothetical protein
MKVGFYVESYEHLGVEYLSAVLKEAGHETEMFFDPRLFNDSSFSIPVFAKWLNVEDLLLDEICNADLDLLCFSVVTDNYSSALRMAARVKEEINITTMFGGIHATSVPERVIKRPEVDYVIVGEGEGAIVDLVTALANGERDFSFPNLHYINGRGEEVANAARPTIMDLDELPFPDKEAFYSKVPAFHQKRYSTAASRGCVYACTFCNNNFYKKMYKGKGRWQRRRSVDNLIAELEWAQERYDIERIQFFDEIFVDHHDWLEEFADKYPKAIGKPFFAWAYPKYCKPEMIELLEKAGCCEVNIGVQTINEYTKRKRLKRGEKTEKVAEAAALFKNSSILLSTGNILEIPGQPIEEGLELAEFYANNRVDMTYVGFMRYYPRTEIIDIGIEEGVLTADDVEMIEEAAEERPFLKPMGDDSHDWLCVRCLVQMTCFMPRWFILFLIRSGWWRRLPTIDVYHVVFTVSYHFRRLWTGKTRFVENYTAPQYAFSIFHYAWKKFRAKSSKSGPTKGEPRRIHDESATDTP